MYIYNYTVAHLVSHMCRPVGILDVSDRKCKSENSTNTNLVCCKGPNLRYSSSTSDSPVNLRYPLA